ncbi:MAG: FAD-binding protein [Gemmatimonadaceae bacterium]
MTLGTQRVTSIDELAEVVGEAAAARTRLRIVAGGGWLDAGRPVRADAALDLSALSGIVDYAPGDFTVTARAGTTLAAIDAAVVEFGQYLPLDPHGARTGTLGATLATASAGPLAASAGTPRDTTLGVTFVDGSGAIVQGGGRVVKNVAGFDLVRLIIGAWGTLGAIGEATLRLRAIPPADLTLSLPMPSGAERLASSLRAIANADIQPLASELLNEAMARRTGAGTSCTLLIRLAGNVSGVRAQRDALSRVAPVQEAPAGIWRRVTEAEPAGARVIRVSALMADVAQLWGDIASRVGADDVLMLASVRRGVVRVCVPPDHEAQLQRLLDQPPARSTVIGERLAVSSWPAPSERLTHRLASTMRETFDPQGILNPGILTPEAA